MSDRRKKTKKRKLYLAIYLCLCLLIILLAYFQLSRMARDYNTRHLELITGLYAEKMNDSMEYLQNYVQEDVKMIQSMEGETPEKILERLQKNLNQQALESEQSFNSDPYQSSQTGNMIMTVFVPVKDSSQIHSLYVSIMIENLRQLGVYELLQGKISVQLLNANSQNYVTCISSGDVNASGSWKKG